MSGSARKPPTDLDRAKMPELTALILAPILCARDRLVGERTALTNQLRAFLVERGLIMPQGRRKLELYLETLPATGPACAGARRQGRAPLSCASL